MADASRLLATLEQLLALTITGLRPALDATTQLLAVALAADKVDAMLYNPAKDSLVAYGTSDTPMGHRQRALGLDQLPLANGGLAVRVFQSGEPYLSVDSQHEPDELRGIVESLGVRSQVLVPLLVGDERRGLLMAGSGTAHFFSPDDLSFLTAVSQWVGVVAHRAELVEQLAADARETGRRLAADDLVTVVAHEINNLLYSARVHLAVLQQKVGPEEVANTQLAVGRLADLVGNLLTSQRLEQGLFSLNPEVFDLVALIRSVIEALAKTGTPVDLTGPDILPIAADRNGIRQILENLLSNAVRHTAAGVQIELKTEAGPVRPVVVIVVSDQGPGIDPAVMPQLFTRFSTGAGSTGLGLGLFLARSFAEAHGGTLSVDSAPGRGATFCLTLPQVVDVRP